jgi:hypothetical protein
MSLPHTPAPPVQAHLSHGGLQTVVESRTMAAQLMIVSQMDDSASVNTAPHWTCSYRPSVALATVPHYAPALHSRSTCQDTEEETASCSNIATDRKKRTSEIKRSRRRTESAGHQMELSLLATLSSVH